MKFTFLIIVLLFACNSIAHTDIEKLSAVVNLLQAGSKVDQALKSQELDVRILLNEQDRRVVVVQNKEGACFAIFPSSLKGSIFQNGDLVLSGAIVARENDLPPIVWRKGELDSLKSDGNVIYINLVRAYSKVTDSLILRHNGDGPLFKIKYNAM